jgi:hypothetical protein
LSSKENQHQVKSEEMLLWERSMEIFGSNGFEGWHSSTSIQGLSSYKNEVTKYGKGNPNFEWKDSGHSSVFGKSGGKNPPIHGCLKGELEIKCV